MTFNSEIRFERVHFHYGDGQDSVLRDFSLSIKKGETIGIVGSSGSGKTTVLKLLLRLIRPQEGHIMVDDQVITEENEASFQRIMGYVEQEVFILDASLVENVAFGDEQADLEKVRQSLKEARLWKFIENHPDGMQLRLGENGVNLSGGQKQRVGIARALYKKAEILAFDEATSALDSETEKAVVESINDLSSLGKTVIIVAHRITTLEKCDRIIELDRGTVVREPAYSDLIKEKIVGEQ